jgi:hypothetical protein
MVILADYANHHNFGTRSACGYSLIRAFASEGEAQSAADYGFSSSGVAVGSQDSVHRDAARHDNSSPLDIVRLASYLAS